MEDVPPPPPPPVPPVPVLPVPLPQETHVRPIISTNVTAASLRAHSRTLIGISKTKRGREARVSAQPMRSLWSCAVELWPVWTLTAILTGVPLTTLAEGGFTVQVEWGGRFAQVKVTSPVKLRSGARAKPKLAAPPELTVAEVPFEPVAPNENGGATVKDVVPTMVCAIAEMVVVPSPALCTSPPLLTVAIVLSDELHATELVTSTLLPRAYSPVAVSWMCIQRHPRGYSIVVPTLALN